MAITDTKYASCNILGKICTLENFCAGFITFNKAQCLSRFGKVDHLVEVGGEANEIEDGGWDEHIEQDSQQLSSQSYGHLFRCMCGMFSTVPSQGSTLYVILFACLVGN